ncbi:MAG: HD-GYP domain-containing protein [Candidatus Aegiribacteria sp.]|nr:HD-GYP domain-containing protein [Candidatus Aegiribacteria sp.]
MINPISEIFGCSNLLSTGFFSPDHILIIAVLAVGSIITGGYPIITSSSIEFSMNRIFIFVIFFLCPKILAFEVTSICFLGSSLLRTKESRTVFWRYLISGITAIAILRTSSIIIPWFLQNFQQQLSIIIAIPAVILSDIILNYLFSRKCTLPVTDRIGRQLISYIVILPLTFITIILLIQAELLGALLAVFTITGFSFIGRSIVKKYRINQFRIREIIQQNILAARLMESFTFSEFLATLEEYFSESEECRVRILSRSSGNPDWILWSLNGQRNVITSEITGSIPGKGRISLNFKVREITATVIGLSDNSDLLLLLSGPTENVIRGMPSNLLDNLTLLLKHAWEAVGHSMRSDKSFLAAAVMLARLADSKDDYTHGHSMRVSDLSCALGRELRLSRKNIQILRVGAILHDIGKLAIPIPILTKRGLLTRREREIIQNHPAEGAKIVSELSGYEEVTKIIRSHHERLDGNGYPDGLQNIDIPFLARIVAIADTFDAITSARSYHSIADQENAIETIKEGKGIQFDSRIVDALEKVIQSESARQA